MIPSALELAIILDDVSLQQQSNNFSCQSNLKDKEDKMLIICLTGGV
jgi:hypothetical protein